MAKMLGLNINGVLELAGSLHHDLRVFKELDPLYNHQVRTSPAIVPLFATVRSVLDATLSSSSTRRLAQGDISHVLAWVAYSGWPFTRANGRVRSGG